MLRPINTDLERLILKDQSNIQDMQQETRDRIVYECSESAKYNTYKGTTKWHLVICKHYNNKVKDKYYEDVSSTTTENDEVTALWNISI